jgi:mono/diheme cytochrome c family protein
MKKQWLYLAWPVALILLLVLVRSFVLDGDAVTRAGEKAYVAYCQSSHGVEGEGFKGIIPPLAGADYLDKHLEELPCLILYGIKGEIVVNGITYNQPMAGVGEEISTAQIQGLIQYMQTSWAIMARASPSRRCRN